MTPFTASPPFPYTHRLFFRLAVRARHQHERLGDSGPEHQLRCEPNRLEYILTAVLSNRYPIEVIDEALVVSREYAVVEDETAWSVVHALAAEGHQGPAVVRQAALGQLLGDVTDQMVDAAVLAHAAVALLRLDDEDHVDGARYAVTCGCG